MTTESRNLRTWLLNPFHYVAGGQALLAGVLCILASAFLGSRINLQFDGVFDFLVLQPYPLGIHVIEGLADWVTFSVVLLAGGKLISRSRFRSLDVFGTQALARFPYFVISVVGLGALPAFIRAAQRVEQSLGDLKDYAAFVSFYVFGLVMAVWMVTLMYRAFTVSCNVKGSKAALVFALASVFGEGVSKVAIFAAKAHLFLAAVALSVATPINGAWLGQLGSGPHSLRVQVVIQDDGAGHQTWSLDSLDQHAMGLPCAGVAYKDGALSFQVPSVNGRWTGSLSKDAKTLVGTWDQGAPQPLDFEKEAQALGR